MIVVDPRQIIVSRGDGVRDKSTTTAVEEVYISCVGGGVVSKMIEVETLVYTPSEHKKTIGTLWEAS